MLKKKISTRVLALALAVAMAIGVGSFAYFSDSIVNSTQGTSGTVAVSLDSDINFLDALGQDILNPGDMRDASSTVTNEGNKSIDVRTTIALTALDRDGNPIYFTGDSETQSEFDLYLKDDVELVEGKGYMPKEGAKPIEVKSIDGNVITYIIPEYSLNGNSDKYDEVETIEGIDTFTHEYDYVLVFKGEAGNAWQDSSISMDMLVEAKQHENTQAGWEVVAQETATHGSINQSVVNGESILTDGGIGNNKRTAWFRVVDEEYYTLQDAINAVEDGGTIEVIKSGYVNVGEVNAGGKTFTITGVRDTEGNVTSAVINNSGTMTGFTNVSYDNVTTKEVRVLGYGDYFDLQDACDAAQTGDVIYVMDDCVVTEAVSAQKSIVFMPYDKDVTITVNAPIELSGATIQGNNGHTITFQANGANLFKNAYSTFTVGDGGILLGSGGNVLFHANRSIGDTNLILKSGSIVGNCTSVMINGKLTTEAGAKIMNVSDYVSSGYAQVYTQFFIAEGTIFENVTMLDRWTAVS